MNQRESRIINLGFIHIKESYHFGIFVMILSAVLFSANTSLVRYAKEMDVYFITFMRFFTGLVYLLILRGLHKIEFNFKNYTLLSLRGIFGALAVLLMNIGITKISLGKGTMLNYTYPVFATLLAPFLNKEHNKLGTWIIQFIALGGCWLLVMPKNGIDFSPLDLIVLGGGVCAGIAVNTIRKLQKNNNTFSIFFVFCFFSCLITGVPAFSNFHMPSLFQWFILLMIGLLGTFGQLAMTYGYKMAPVNEGSLIGFLVPVLNFFISWLIFKESLSVSVISGSALVIVCCIITMLRKVS
ncbi:MAG: DMT family transporter [Candidatus Cloacimonetes bacterium]|jgi:drug/metabolite transporter (DMT)-like permease|nr:DMT family transporter [Candidatus Cloacimonadota bacterium]